MLNAYLTTHLEIIPASGVLGAELQGINLAGPVAPDTASAIRGALAEHGVIFFRDQMITPEQHIAFAESLAPIDINRFFKTASGYPQISEVRKEPASRLSESESSILPLAGQHAQCRLVVSAANSWDRGRLVRILLLRHRCFLRTLLTNSVRNPSNTSPPLLGFLRHPNLP